ncbi:3D domain protein [Bacillus phage vB_BboS-125]|uniref:3D domain protein n=1 Tax=Bacillus phage vB_BboS-125 TaxID=2419618 RepID=A0A3G3BVY3_9CAUD|nr:3D domain protein [Bacillus phage vB_BboS-125]AYP68423.1 3D domain protein [Bacillus phage vB_BboS-125]
MKKQALAGAAIVALALIILTNWGPSYEEEPGKQRVQAPTTGQTARQGEEQTKQEAEEGKGLYEITRTNAEEGKPSTTAAGGSSRAGEGNSTTGTGSSGLQYSLGTPEADYKELDRHFHEMQAAERKAAAESRQPGTGDSRQLASRGSAATYYDAGIFQITAYTAGYESTGKHPGDPAYGVTATGTTVKEGRTIAADWSILPPGTVVRIQGLEGYYTVEDRGGAVVGNIIDLYIEDLEEAITWGRQERKLYVKEWVE